MEGNLLDIEVMRIIEHIEDQQTNNKYNLNGFKQFLNYYKNNIYLENILSCLSYFLSSYILTFRYYHDNIIFITEDRIIIIYEENFSIYKVIYELRSKEDKTYYFIKIKELDLDYIRGEDNE